jgi:hypothetical protein
MWRLAGLRAAGLVNRKELAWYTAGLMKIEEIVW